MTYVLYFKAVDKKEQTRNAKPRNMRIMMNRNGELFKLGRLVKGYQILNIYRTTSGSPNTSRLLGKIKYKSLQLIIYYNQHTAIHFQSYR